MATCSPRSIIRSSKEVSEGGSGGLFNGQDRIGSHKDWLEALKELEASKPEQHLTVVKDVMILFKSIS